MLSAEQRAWSKKLEKLLAVMPAGIEIIVGLGNVAVMEAGFYKREICGSDIDMMSAGGTLISENALHQFGIDPERVRANSESI